MIFEIISGGEKTDWVGKEWAGLFFPRGKNGPAHSFPGEKLTGGKFQPVTGTVSFFPSQFFPRGKNGPAHSFPGEKTDWGKN